MNMEIRGGTDMVAISRGIGMVSILLTPAGFSFTKTHPFQEIPGAVPWFFQYTIENSENPAWKPRFSAGGLFLENRAAVW